MLSKPTLGIDRGSRETRLVALRGGKGKASLAWQREIASEGVQLRDLASPRSPAATAVPRDRTAAKRLELPTAPRAKQQQMLALEVDDHLPFAAGASVFALASVRPEAPVPRRGEAGPAGMQDLLLIGAPDDAVAQAETWCSQIGARKARVTASCVASARGVNDLLGTDTPSAARLIADVGASTVTLTVAEEDRVLYARTAMTGIDDLVAAVQAEDGCDRETAEQKSRAEGLLDIEDHGRAGTRRWLQDLLSEIRGTLLEYGRAEPARPTVELVLTGTGASTPGLASLLTTALGMPARLPPAPTGFEGAAEGFAPFVTAYGLALLAGDRRDQQVLLQSHERVRVAQQTRVRRRRTAQTIVSTTVGLILAAAGTWGWQQDAANRDVLRQEVKALQKKQSKLSTLLDAKQELDRYTELNTVSRQQRPWLQVVAAVSTALPDNVWLTNLSGRRGQPLQIEGRSLSNAAVAEFTDALAKQTGIASADLQYSRSAQVARKRLVEFSILCEVASAAPERETPRVTPQ